MSANSFRSLFRNLFSTPENKKQLARRTRKSRRRAFFESLEDRSMMAVTALFNVDTLTISLDSASDSAYVQVDGTNIDVATSEGGEDILADQAGVTTIIVQDTGAAGGR